MNILTNNDKKNAMIELAKDFGYKIKEYNGYFLIYDPNEDLFNTTNSLNYIEGNSFDEWNHFCESVETIIKSSGISSNNAVNYMHYVINGNYPSDTELAMKIYQKGKNII